MKADKDRGRKVEERKRSIEKGAERWLDEGREW